MDTTALWWVCLLRCCCCALFPPKRTPFSFFFSLCAFYTHNTHTHNTQKHAKHIISIVVLTRSSSTRGSTMHSPPSLLPFYLPVCRLLLLVLSSSFFLWVELLHAICHLPQHMCASASSCTAARGMHAQQRRIHAGPPPRVAAPPPGHLYPHTLSHTHTLPPLSL
jgi:hypothetical protein